MSAPEPGWMPMMVPSTLPRSTGHLYFLLSCHMPRNTLPIFCAAISGACAVETT